MHIRAYTNMDKQTYSRTCTHVQTKDAHKDAQTHIKRTQGCTNTKTWRNFLKKDKPNSDHRVHCTLVEFCSGSVLCRGRPFVPSPYRGEVIDINRHQVPVSADPVSSEESTGFKSTHSLLEEEEEEEEEPPRILLYHGERVLHLRTVGKGPILFSIP